MIKAANDKSQAEENNSTRSNSGQIPDRNKLFQFKDNRADSIDRQKLKLWSQQGLMSKQDGMVQRMTANDSALAGTKFNNTGLPDRLKSGIETLSGYSMDDVKVHYNSDKPSQLNAHAYAQGTDIHLAPGQEKHLPHEAWHVVQQKQGRVKPTRQLKQKIKINDDPSLEIEADIMGSKANSNVQEGLRIIEKTNTEKIKNPVLQGYRGVLSDFPFNPLAVDLGYSDVGSNEEERTNSDDHDQERNSYETNSDLSSSQEAFLKEAEEMEGEIDTSVDSQGGFMKLDAPYELPEVDKKTSTKPRLGRINSMKFQHLRSQGISTEQALEMSTTYFETEKPGIKEWVRENRIIEMTRPDDQCAGLDSIRFNLLIYNMRKAGINSDFDSYKGKIIQLAQIGISGGQWGTSGVCEDTVLIGLQTEAIPISARSFGSTIGWNHFLPRSGNKGPNIYDPSWKQFFSSGKQEYDAILITTVAEFSKFNLDVNEIEQYLIFLGKKKGTIKPWVRFYRQDEGDMGPDESGWGMFDDEGRFIKEEQAPDEKAWGEITKGAKSKDKKAKRRFFSK